MDEGQLLNDRYRLGDRLGEGGMSVVWRAHDEVLGRSVAVKVLAGTFAADAAWRRRIRTEAQAAASLSHPNVTNVYDYGETPEGNPFVVMELLRGPTLAERLAAGPLSPAAAIRVAAEVAAGLAAAHAERLVHRDVKPANVVLTQGAAKLVDFGIVGIADDPGSGLDASGHILGTPAYLAPERLVGDDAVPASDVYAFGLLLYRCLTGRLPWDSETTTQMLRSHVTVAPEPLPDLPAVPPEVRELCMRCLVKAPAARPSAEETAAVLAAAAGVSPRPDAEEFHLAPAAAPPAVSAASGADLGDATTPVDRIAATPAAGDATDLVAAAATRTGGDATGPVAMVARRPPGEGATDVIGDDAGDRRRVLAGLAVAVGVAALLVTVALNRPAGTPQVVAEAARGNPAGTAGAGAGPSPSDSTPAAVDPTPSAGGQPQGNGGQGNGGQGNGGQGNNGQGNGGKGNGGTGGNTGNGSTGGGTPVRIGTPGGVIVAVCVGDRVDVTGAEPAPGGSLVDLQSGPRGRSRVEFNLAGTRLRFEVRCAGGVPVATPD
ncbi:serine/threonine-protein kinase [Dactylosporangium sp. NPDC005555]|uniref:serine/threonine-protein kinase n=1 Tax=Dactylosporangium sp. NPDC005555 TaxID=3154889 RepID=UPI0033B32D1D